MGSCVELGPQSTWSMFSFTQLAVCCYGSHHDLAPKVLLTALYITCCHLVRPLFVETIVVGLISAKIRGCTLKVIRAKISPLQSQWDKELRLRETIK